MDKNFLQLRGHGCSGVWEMFMQARALRDNMNENAKDAAPQKADQNGKTLRLALLLAPAERWQQNIWEESATRLGVPLLCHPLEANLAHIPEIASPAPADENAAEKIADQALHKAVSLLAPKALALIAEQDASMLLVGGVDASILEALDLPVPVVNVGNNAARPCEVLADMLSTVRRLGSAADNINTVRIGWMGGADAANAGYVNSWLDLVLCFQHEFFLAFPQGREPEPEPLDFAMNAGGRIFLTYEPHMILDGVHTLIAAPWQPPQETPNKLTALPIRHPLLSDDNLAKATSKAGESMAVYPLAEVLPMPEALRQERQNCLVACQMAMVTRLAANAS